MFAGNSEDPYNHFYRLRRRPMLLNLGDGQPTIGYDQRFKRKQHFVNLLARMNRKDSLFDYFNRV